eukprot:CAMPEP_0201577888 /NCGR_PEP_ID=MMETSP0190_2-20130828/24456_1 /ASSEMBLY_ACC=CAM_ASM_000263 /TAXON_ID=37353 /ORGANISM="Rosalina sp." /LENGTH=81 /DNA_ID=CAMNT_0048010403 /DNA_START=48 /DNA_END=293 /DNA_ORIENTATION=+
MEEIAKHDSADNGVWIVINDLVYDVTKFLGEHPGGAMILITVAGEDGTSEYDDAAHPASVMDQANGEFLIGKLKKKQEKDK